MKRLTNIRSLLLLSLAATTAGAFACSSKSASSGVSVIQTDPADSQLNVPVSTSIKVGFSVPMLGSTITTDALGNGCTGSLQLSSNGFATCIALTAPVGSNGNASWVAVPIANLTLGARYKIRVTTGASSLAGQLLSGAFTQPDGFVVGNATPTPTPGAAYSHTILTPFSATNDSNDFIIADEQFTTSSTVDSTPPYYGYVTWDSTNLFLGMSGGDMLANLATKDVVMYFGGPAGTTTGMTYNTQRPLLPFPAQWHVHWQTDNGSTEAFVWTGAAWVTTTWSFAGLVYESAQGVANDGFLEMAIPRSRLGNPSHLPFVMGMINDGNDVESSYAAVPHDAYVDGYMNFGTAGKSTGFATWFDFNLDGPTAPNATVEQ